MYEVRKSTARTFLTINGKMNMFVRHYYIKTACIHKYFYDELYMRQPEGIVEKGREDQVCKLKKSIYGLKQAAGVWNLKNNQFLFGNRIQKRRSRFMLTS